jgi:hypothetical protein
MSRHRILVAIVGLALVSLLGVTPTAGAQTSGDGELGPDYVRATARDLGSGTFPGGGLPSAPPPVDPPYEWSRAPTGGRCMVFPGAIPAALTGAVTPLRGVFTFPYASLQVGALQGAPSGAVRVDGSPALPAGVVPAGDFVIDTATPREGTGLLIVPRCAQPGEPLPPALPTAAEIWEQTPLPRGSVHASPPGTDSWPGIVNLESRFWAAPLADANATVGLRGYVVTVFAHPVGYAWSFGQGTTSVSDAPGGPDAPARAEYRRRGDYDVTLYVVWAGLAHTTAPAFGLDFGVQNLGTVTLPVTIGYHEAEIRALLRSRTARG